MNWFTFRIPQPAWRPEGDPPSTPPTGDPPATPPVTPPAGDPPATPPAGDPPAARGTPPANAITKEGDAPTKGAGDWPSDWRERMATGADGKVDAKALEALKRRDSPMAVFRGLQEADRRINSGKVNADEPMPDPEKDAEGAKAWRAARGVPAEATGYTLPDNLTKMLIDEDKPVLAAFYSDAHKAGIPNQHVTPMVNWYLQMQEAQATERNALDKTQSEETEEALRSEWGSDFKPNRTAAKRYADEVVPGLFDARMPDGRIVGNAPAFVKGLAKLALLEFGDVSFVGGEHAASTENRMTELKKIMDTDWDRWEKSPDLKTEYWKLVEANAKRTGNRAA